MNAIREWFLSPLHWGYLLFVILGILLACYGMALEWIDKRKSILKQLTDKEFYRSGTDQFLDLVPFVVASEEKMARQMDVLDVTYTPRTITKLKIAGLAMGAVIAYFFKNWMLAFPMMAICMQIPGSFVEMQVSKRVRQYNDQVLEAFQVFITEFTTTKSVQKTIVNICPKLKYPLRKEFERLGRKLNSGAQIEECFMEFAHRTQNKWTMIFAQMMITYFRNGGDFSEHLLNITQSITGEKILDEQNTTELSSMKIINIACNALVPIAYVANQFMNPQDNAIFTTTASGRFIIFAVAVSSLASLYMGRKITDM